MRLFIALGLPDHARDALEALQADLNVGRDVAPENLHVTLAFLDDQPETMAKAVHERLCEVDLPAFDMRIRGLDVISRKQPRLVCAGVDASEPLTALRRKIRTRVREAGVDLPRQRFRPHVTLARFATTLPRYKLDRLGGFLERHGAMALEPIRADHFTLYQSRLTPDGPRYDPLADYPLR